MVAALALVRTLLFAHGNLVLVWWAVALSFGMLLLVPVVACLAQGQRLGLQDSEFFVVDMLRRRRSVPLSTISGICAVRIRIGGSGTVVSRWFVVDGRGRKVAEISPSIWDPGELWALAKAMGVVVHHREDRILSAREVNDEVPGALAWWRVHTVAVGIVGAIAVIAVLSWLFR